MLWANSVREMWFGYQTPHTVDTVVQSDKWRRIFKKKTNTESNSFREQELALCLFTNNQKNGLCSIEGPWKL